MDMCMCAALVGGLPGLCPGISKILVTPLFSIMAGLIAEVLFTPFFNFNAV